MRTILTIFAGRKANLEILRNYLEKSLAEKIIDEVHYWNYSRNIEDDLYLKNTSNIKRTIGQYVECSLKIINNSFEIIFDTASGICVKLMYSDDAYEIIIEENARVLSIIGTGGYILCRNNTEGLYSESINLKICIVDNILSVILEGKRVLLTSIITNFNIERILVKSNSNLPGHLIYKTVRNQNFFLMDTDKKSGWTDYYRHYAHLRYKKDIIIKSDDDILFIDTMKFLQFIRYVETSENYDIIFSNIVNNGVCAYYQQKKFNLIPANLLELEYPNNGLCGSLWASGQNAEKLHLYFLKNIKNFLEYKYNAETVEVFSRFSINFFGCKGSNWHKIKHIGLGDDEYDLTVKLVGEKKIRNVIYFDFYVAHLSFYKQIETGIDLDKLRNEYRKLCKNLLFK